MQEERRRIARHAAPFGRRIDHPVGGRRQHVVGQPLEHVADVADHAAGRRIDRQPGAVAILDLQPGLLGAQQEGDGVDVLVRAGADVGTIERRGRIVQQPQDAVAEVGGGGEEARVEVQVAGDGPQHLVAEMLQGVEQPLFVGVEGRNLGRPDVVRHARAVRMPGRQLAADVPEFLQVEVRRALGGLNAKGGVAALPGDAVDLVAALHLVRQGEKGLGVGDGGVDPALVQAVVGDHREAVAGEGAAEGLGKAVEVPGVEAERDGRDGAAGESFSQGRRPPALHF